MSRRLEPGGRASDLFQSRFAVPATHATTFLDALEADGLSVAAFETPEDDVRVGHIWQIEVLHDEASPSHGLMERVDALAARIGLGPVEMRTAPVPDVDWLARNALQFPPQRIGRFWIRGSHVEDEAPTGTVPVLIDAGLAFGSGEHPSTRGCLLVIDRFGQRPWVRRMLDLGCGSGLLSIAASRAWPTARILAVDCDPRAVAVTRNNLLINGVGATVGAAESDGYQGAVVRQFAPYDLVIANVLADPLTAWARSLARYLAPGGVAVLAGILDRQAAHVAAAHRRAGLALAGQVNVGSWATLAFSERGQIHRVRRLLGDLVGADGRGEVTLEAADGGLANRRGLAEPASNDFARPVVD